MAHALLTVDEPLWRSDGRMAGLPIRAHEMAAALARAGHTVTVAAPAAAGASLAAGYAEILLDDVSRLPADVWITHPRLVARLRPTLAHLPLVVDGYESPFGSFLAHAAALLPSRGERVMLDYRTTVVDLVRALPHADRVLAATESQRVSYLTLLAALGRLGPRHPGDELVLAVCSGAPPLPLPRGEHDGPPTLLWYGGGYPWFDVETFLAALPAVCAAVPAVRVVFAGLGGIDEGAGAPPLAKASAARAAIAAAPALAARTTLLGWQPYAERAALYAATTVGVCTYAAGLETRFAMRTRVLDMLWGGLPLVVTRGDDVARRLAGDQAGLVVPPGDAAALAEALVAMLTDPARRQAMAERARALAAGPLSWDAQIVPLAAYCDAVARGDTPRLPAVPATDAVLRPNAGWALGAADAFRRIAYRAAGLGTRLRGIQA